MLRQPPTSTPFPTHALPISDFGGLPPPGNENGGGGPGGRDGFRGPGGPGDRKSTRLNSSHTVISYAVFCLKKKTYSQFRSGLLTAELLAKGRRRWRP